MASGHLIVVRFDLNSCGYTQGYKFDADKVLTHYSEGILGANKLEVAEALAAALNEKMAMCANEILGHARESYSILDALDIGALDLAYWQALRLAENLQGYEPRAGEIWGNWIEKVIEYAVTQNRSDYPDLDVNL